MFNPDKIEKRHLILCEGKDAEGFLREYLRSQFAEQYSGIQVADFGGNRELRKSLALLRVTPGFSDLCSLLVIRDVETDFQPALNQVRDALRENSYAAPNKQGKWAESSEDAPRTCFLLFPGLGRNTSTGTLEHLCISILAEDDADTVMGRIDTFLDTLKRDGLRKEFSRLHKTQLHTYFSITDKLVTKNVGIAAQAGAFNWSHPNLKPLKDCISKMTE